MLACYTTGGAYANFQEKDTGSIEAGKLADLVVLDRDLFAIPATEIAKARVMATFLGGRAVYEAEAR
jgi:predicted amidohydrolase YtcJ